MGFRVKVQTGHSSQTLLVGLCKSGSATETKYQRKATSRGKKDLFQIIVSEVLVHGYFESKMGLNPVAGPSTDGSRVP